MINQPDTNTGDGQEATQKRDVWTFSNLSKLCVNGLCKGTFTPWQDDSVKTLLTALNGTPADDGIVISPDRYWYERSLEADAEITDLKRQLAAKDGSIKNFLDEIEEYQKDTIDLNAEIADLKRQLADKDIRMEYLDDLIKAQAKTIYESDRTIAELEAETDRLTNRLRERNDKSATITAQDWDPKKEPATVTHGPIEEYRPWTMDDVRAGTILRWHDGGTAVVTRVRDFGLRFDHADYTFAELLRTEWRQLNGDRCGGRKEGANLRRTDR